MMEKMPLIPKLGSAIKIKYIGLFIFISACYSTPSNRWKIQSISGETLSTDERNTFYTFLEDGKLIREISGRKGNGQWQRENQKLTLSFGNKKEYYTIQTWDNEHLILIQEKDTLILTHSL